MGHKGHKEFLNYYVPNVTLLVKLEFIMVSIYLFGILRHFQHCTGHITTGSWKGRGNQYIQLVKVLYY